MAITFDPAKRDWTLVNRGLNFADAVFVFDGPVFEFEDIRKDYGEQRFVCVGQLNDRMVIIGWTPRGADRHVFSMRKANEREEKRYAERLR